MVKDVLIAPLLSSGSISAHAYIRLDFVHKEKGHPHKKFTPLVPSPNHHIQSNRHIYFLYNNARSSSVRRCQHTGQLLTSASFETIESVSCNTAGAVQVG